MSSNQTDTIGSTRESANALFAEVRERGVSFVKELSFIDTGLWGFEITDADGYVLACFSYATSSVATTSAPPQPGP